MTNAKVHLENKLHKMKLVPAKSVTVCEREKERELLSVEEEDEESKGNYSLVKKVSHGNKGESTVVEKPSRMEIPPARRPQIHRVSSAAPLPEEADGDGRREK